jgi:hypothetical protein
MSHRAQTLKALTELANTMNRLGSASRHMHLTSTETHKVHFPAPTHADNVRREKTVRTPYDM